MDFVLHRKVATRKQIRRTLNIIMRLTKIKYSLRAHTAHSSMCQRDCARDWLQFVCQCEGKTCRMIWRLQLELSICENRQCYGSGFFLLLFQRKENTVGMLWQNEDVRAHQTHWLLLNRNFQLSIGKIVYSANRDFLLNIDCVCALRQ